MMCDCQDPTVFGHTCDSAGNTFTVPAAIFQNITNRTYNSMSWRELADIITELNLIRANHRETPGNQEKP